MLQLDDSTLAQVRYYLDTVLDIAPRTKERLIGDAEILENSNFESALVNNKLDKKINTRRRRVF